MLKSSPISVEVVANNPISAHHVDHHVDRRDTIPGIPPQGSYGKLIYEIEEHVEKARTNITSTQLNVRFYESVVMFEQTEKFLCYPEAFEIKVIPKYRIRNIVVSKAQIPKWMFYLGCFKFILGIVLLIIGGNQKDQKEANGGSNKGESKGNKSELEGGGAFLLIGGLVLLALPFFLNKYFVTLTFTRPRAVASLWTYLFPSAEEVLTFRTKERPNDALLMSYAYGALNTNMEDFHLLSHMINDDMTQPLAPINLKDTQV